ncbi:MAG: hypothetical protein QXO42_02615 [Ignisphaera sp.]
MSQPYPTTGSSRTMIQELTMRIDLKRRKTAKDRFQSEYTLRCEAKKIKYSKEVERCSDQPMMYYKPHLMISSVYDDGWRF